MSKDASKKNGQLLWFLAFLKPWFAFTGLYAAFSVCPFCGQSGCPTGIGGAGLVGTVFALFTKKWDMLTGRRKNGKQYHICEKENSMKEQKESGKYQATDIDAGYHPLGFRIDKEADPLNRYTKWTIDNDGNWITGKPVCFHSLPTDGWIKVENNGRMESDNA